MLRPRSGAAKNLYDGTLNTQNSSNKSPSKSTKGKSENNDKLYDNAEDVVCGATGSLDDNKQVNKGETIYNTIDDLNKSPTESTKENSENDGKHDNTEDIVCGKKGNMDKNMGKKEQEYKGETIYNTIEDLK